MKLKKKSQKKNNLSEATKQLFKLNKKNSWNKIIKNLGGKYKIWSNSPDDITLN